ncbi:MAG: aminomethyl-transferring glycine dehydrogenase subunit GcvPA [Candidatus Aminicenantes bacterium]|nr:MAG: aminomethyl-transferring glycine dehydrogenase subunit GcvPA [Candidatus Aminicenantes bacterium]
MKKKQKIVHPYIPNSVPKVKAKMLEEIGVKDIDELYNDIPESLRFKGEMNLPKPLTSEYALKRHVEKILSKNQTCEENISFLGGGCSQHYIPAICDEINQRSEFLTAYAGEPYEDHGRFQTLFEYESLMAELLDMDVVNVPTYDWCQAASTSLRMAGRITKRNEILISDTVSPDRFMAINNYCRPVLRLRLVKHCPKTGLMDLDDLKLKISVNTAGIYFENPSYLGFIEHQGKAISDIAHEEGALSIVGVDPISLGVMMPPSNYEADIVCGDIQGLGIHMNYGGGHGGFIATRDEEKFVMEYPSRLFGITKTSVEGEYGFGDVAYERTSFAVREEGKEFIGTCAALWGITAGVYLSLMGPRGMQELGKAIMQKSQYAMKKLSEIKGIKAPLFDSPHFKEFIVEFNDTWMAVKDINIYLREHRIFGGKDLSREFPELGNCAMYCITEIHTKDDIDKLVQALSDCLE